MPALERPLPTSEARSALTAIVGRFRNDGIAAEPVVFGSHRKPEAVIVPYDQYALMRDLLEDAVIAGQLEERRRSDTGVRIELDEFIRELGYDPEDL